MELFLGYTNKTFNPNVFHNLIGREGKVVPTSELFTSYLVNGDLVYIPITPLVTGVSWETINKLSLGVGREIIMNEHVWEIRLPTRKEFETLYAPHLKSTPSIMKRLGNVEIFDNYEFLLENDLQCDAVMLDDGFETVTNLLGTGPSVVNLKLEHCCWAPIITYVGVELK